MTAAFNIFARTVVRRNGLPFPVELETPNAETLAAIEEVERMEHNQNKKLYSNVRELLADLNADD